MTKVKNKYFYSEIEDKVIVDFVQHDFKKRQEERRPYELIWELNMNFYLGNQYSYISNKGSLSDIEKNYYWESREVYNHIAPVIESRLAKLSKVKPTLTAKPVSNSDADIYAAKLSKFILSKFAADGELSPLIASANFWSEVTGTSFYKVSWDSTLGDTIGIFDDKVLKNGDAKVSVCSPFEIYPSSNSCNDIDDCESIIEARAVPVKNINETWGTSLDGENIDIYEIGNSSFLSGISGRSNLTKIAHSKKSDHALLLERYEKPSKKYPNGKLTIVCKNMLLYDGDLPYRVGKDGTRGFPFIRQVSIQNVSSFWGSSVIERIIPIQRAYNAIKNKKHEFIARLASGVLCVEDGSVDIDNLEENGLAPGKILVYRNGSTPPKFLDPGNVPSEFEKEEEKLLNEINTLSSVSDITTNSSVPKNITSATAISLLVEQDDSRLAITAESIRQAIRSIGIMILRLYKQFAESVRLGKILDGSGTLEVFYFCNSDLTSDDVLLETSNELEETLEDKKSMILSLYDKGLLSDEKGVVPSSVKARILSLLGIRAWENYVDTKDLQRERAVKENNELIELAEPLDIDDHEIHIDEHTRFIISDFGNKLSNQKREKLLQHIKLHKEKLLKN